MKNVRVGWEAISESASIISSPAYQLADVPSSISSINALGTDTLTSTGLMFPTSMFDLSANTKTRQLFRAGMFCLNSAGSGTLNVTNIRMWIEWEDS